MPSSRETIAIWLALAFLFFVAIVLRVHYNNVIEFSPDDESVYDGYARILAHGGAGAYPEVVATYLRDRHLSLYPSPLRWSFIGTAAMAYAAKGGAASFRDLTNISTASSIAIVFLIWLIAREILDRRSALAAVALAVTSPLTLALGRRALADEFFCALFLLAVFTAIKTATGESGRKRLLYRVAWIVSATLTFAAKEQFLLVYPVVILFAIWLKRRVDWADVVGWLAPMALYPAIFSLLARNVSQFFTIARITTSTVGAAYPEQYQNGPPQRLLIDYMAVSPFVAVLAIAVVTMVALRVVDEPRLRPLVGLIIAAFAVHAFFSSKNLRYVIPLDPLSRIAVAGFFVNHISGRRHSIAFGAVLLVNAIVELFIFNRVFVVGQVYDPVTNELLRTLKMLPH